MQQTPLKALARKALACNTTCNTLATNPEKPCNKQAPKTPPNVARNVAPVAHLPNTRERLLAVARELGLPDGLVLQLPERELAATAAQTTWYGDAEVRHRLLCFYLRALAGEEPALPGSIAAREVPARRAHVAALRQQASSAREGRA